MNQRALALRAIWPVIVYICWFGRIASGYPGGAGTQSCDDMLPHHHHTQAQTTRSPFTVTQNFSSSSYQPNTIYEVALEVDPSQDHTTTFKGFFCQGREAGSSTTSTGVPLGTFVDFPGQIAQPRKCSGIWNSAVTHTSSSQKSLVVLRWKSPSTQSTDIEIRCTFVQHYKTFWQQVRPTTGVIPTTPPMIPVSTVPPQTLLQINTSDCGVEKGCYQRPKTCTDELTCDYLYTQRIVMPSSDPTQAVVEIELAAKLSSGQGWVAVGFSDDSRMGDDDVLACEVTRSGAVVAKNTWDRGERNTVDNSANGAQYLMNIETSQHDGRISCRFQRALKTANSITDRDLSKKWHLMFGTRSSGYGEPNSALNGQHNRNPVVTSQRLSVNDTFSIIANEPASVLVTLHGALMILAWLLACPYGLFLARFVRTEFVKLNRVSWFKVHRGVMVGVWVSSILATMLVFIKVGGFSHEHELHAIAGLFTVSLAFIQPFMALLRCSPEDTRRPIFNRAHLSVGYLAQILGAASVFLGLGAFEALEGAKKLIGFVTWALWLLLMIGLWVGYIIYSYCIKKSGDGPSYMLMGNPTSSSEEDGSTSSSSPSLEEKEHSMKSTTKPVSRCFLIVFAVAATVFPVVLFAVILTTISP